MRETKDGKNENKEEQASGTQVWQAQLRKNYAGVFKAADVLIPCYSKKQMKYLYPNGGYQVIGEYARDGQKSYKGSLFYGDTALPLSKYGSNNRLMYCVKGFIAVEPDEDYYAAVLGNMVIYRAVALGLFLAALILGIASATAKNGQDVIVPAAELSSAAEQSSAAVSVELESGAVDWEGMKVSETSEAAEDGIRIPGYKSITIQADTTEVSVNLQNPEQNNCYFVIRLVLADTGEILYESKMIEPGKGLYNITLSRAIEAGTYSAQLQYEPYNMSTLTRLNGAVINLELIAE